jgi:DNA modification methylase
MDPFTGLGSTAVACARLGVGFIGADLDEAYLKVAVERTKSAGRRELPVRGTARMKKAELRPNAPLSRAKSQ